MTVKANVVLTCIEPASLLHQDGNHVTLQPGESHSWDIDQNGDTAAYSLEELGNDQTVKASVNVTAQDVYINFWFDAVSTYCSPELAGLVHTSPVFIYLHTTTLRISPSASGASTSMSSDRLIWL